MTLLDDDALLGRLRTGDARAFEELVERYGGRLYGLALRVVKNEQDAHDVVQDTLLSLHRHLDSYRGDAPFWPWLRRIASNHALMRLRTKRRKPETSLEVAPTGFDAEGSHTREVRDIAPLADQAGEDEELGRRIREAVEALPESHRLVLLLADYEERSMKEIAEALDLTVPNVKTRLHRARLQIRARLEDYLAGRD